MSTMQDIAKVVAQSCGDFDEHDFYMMDRDVAGAPDGLAMHLLATVLRAIRVPPAAIIDAGLQESYTHSFGDGAIRRDGVGPVFTAMIDAILNENPAP